jgi:lauroyl/myristoyl acyltransferase
MTHADGGNEAVSLIIYWTPEESGGKTMPSERRISTLQKIFKIMDATLLGVFNSVRFLARYVPASVLVAIADGLGVALYYARRGAREYLLQTMRECLPQVSDKDIRHFAKQAFGTPFRSMLDVILVEYHGDEIMDKLVTDERLLVSFDKHKAAGKGLIVFSPHLGNMAIILPLARLGRCWTPFVANPDDTPVPRYLHALFGLIESLGPLDPESPVFFRGRDSIEKIREHLLQGKIIGITYDMMGSTIVDLFGRPAAIASGIAQFACDLNVPVLPGYLKRTEDPLRFELVYNGDLEYTLTGDREADVKSILDEVVRRGEEMIRQAPGQWMGWFGMRTWRKRAEKLLREKSGS